jgi:hypothetical protein
MQATEKIISNSIGVTIDIKNDKTNCRIKIRLNDECKNGHEDFAITGDFWTPGKARIDKNYECGGCCHDEILALRPDLKPFVDLHLSDWEGRPMHGFANGFYHLKNDKIDYVISGLRLKPGEIDKIKHAETETHFAVLCMELGLPERWKIEALEATALLEKLGGDVYKFQSTATRKMFELPSNEKVNETIALIESGHFSPENIQQRAKDAEIAAFDKEIQKLNKALNEQHDKANREFWVKIALLEHFRKPVNAIYYNHSNTLKFNWLNYEKKVEKSEVENFIFNQYSYELPKDLKIEY